MCPIMRLMTMFLIVFTSCSSSSSSITINKMSRMKTVLSAKIGLNLSLRKLMNSILMVRGRERFWSITANSTPGMAGSLACKEIKQF